MANIKIKLNLACDTTGHFLTASAAGCHTTKDDICSVLALAF